jgi:hypothetical protein
MALGSPTLKSDAWRSQNGNSNPALSDGSGYKNIYISDPSFENYYINHLSVSNPVVDAMNSSIDGEGVHVQENINFFRTIDIKITHEPTAATSWDAQKTQGWGNWRNESGIKVDSRVMLYIEDMSKIGLTYTQNFGYAWDEVAGSGALGKVADMAKKLQNSAAMLQAANGGSMQVDASTPMGRFQKVPYIKSVEPFKVEPSSLTFSFNFGQAGIFSGEQEVVRPIIALARIFIPYQIQSGERAGDWLNLGAPTQAQVYANIAKTMQNFLSEEGSQMKKILSDTTNAISEDFDITHLGDSLKQTTSNAVVGASNVATNFLKGMYRRIDQGLSNAMSTGKNIILRVGRYQLPPCFPSDISWNFDFSHVDEYGFPLKGTITFGGLQSPKCGELTDIIPLS